MEWSIQQIAQLTGTTSRTLRHYGAVGLLLPSRVGHNGYRYYDEDALLRLQRILLLRELGLGLAQIAEVLAREGSEESALATHLAWLRREQERLSRQIAAVEKTLKKRREGGPLMAQEMFDGFDHTEHREEVVQRWGTDAYERSDAWWRARSAEEKSEWSQRTAALVRAWIDAAERGADPAGEAAQDLAARHVAWLAEVPGTPAAEPAGDVAGYVLGLADMYVGDPRFARTYATSAGGTAGAEFVRAALRVYADTSL
ncbi:MerR family transcriptional regulator [Microbacterium lushaniae]|nr:MerR family transcriptional regulator [Microbacterium lushaniae]KAA9154451.1 MerR family transcriptional regulator [Microbacterium lushaniae]